MLKYFKNIDKKNLSIRHWSKYFVANVKNQQSFLFLSSESPLLHNKSLMNYSDSAKHFCLQSGTASEHLRAVSTQGQSSASQYSHLSAEPGLKYPQQKGGSMKRMTKKSTRPNMMRIIKHTQQHEIFLHFQSENYSSSSAGLVGPVVSSISSWNKT